MEQLINRIKTAISTLETRYQASERVVLNDGASEAALAQLEAHLGFSMPDDVKALYRLHDGEASWCGFFKGEEWLPIENVQSEYDIWHQLYQDGCFDNGECDTDQGCSPNSAAIKPDHWWNPKWLPLTADGSGNGLMIDLDPSTDGNVGQIIQMWHDEPDRSLIAPSLRAYLEAYAQDLENGVYVIHPDYYGVIAKSDLSAKELAAIGIKT